MNRIYLIDTTNIKEFDYLNCTDKEFIEKIKGIKYEPFIIVNKVSNQIETKNLKIRTINAEICQYK